MKLPNNYGQVCKLSGARRRPFMVRKTIGYENNGRAIYHIIGYYPTKADALDALAKFNSQDIPQPSITLGKIYKTWFPTHSKHVSPSTANGYINGLRHLGAIATMPINTIKYRQLQSVIDNMINAGLSYASLKKIRSLINQLYTYALINEWTDKNLATYLTIGKNTPVRPHKPFTTAQINKLWRCQNPNAYLPLIMLYSGMRSTELRHLKRTDINIKQKYFDIKTSKTKSGIRIIPIHERIWPLIQSLLSNNTKYLLGDTIPTYAQISRRFKSVMSDIKATHTTHDCRHTFATLLDNANANYNAKRRLLGHAANNVTDGVYTHKTLSQLRKAIKLLK
ncbi:tyrosine-type recombinase/integrase [uncultured Veillonella sp.]|uniref:tyrosine-type recombinase/integrase n=1 Tax=uncultured Veillonella sp. TaxID=159268 RepID=UPI00262EE8AF|nr:tyrosine-type recombinase/integrase [uncultured Veillonella sp.]